MTWGHSLERIGVSLYTCAKYSSEILPAHSMHRSRGRHGLATSAHLIIMRLIRIWFSGKFFPIGLHSQSLPSIWKTDCQIRVGSRWRWNPQGLTDQHWIVITQAHLGMIGIQVFPSLDIFLLKTTTHLNQNNILKRSKSLSAPIPLTPILFPKGNCYKQFFVCF